MEGIASILIERLLIAAILGALVGAERDFSGRPAGIRTNLIISVSSCLFTILSIFAFADKADPRVAASIVTGVGFLGAGALIHQKDHVMGLTTAADIWLVSAIGMAVGAGFYGLAFSTSLLIVFALVALAPVSYWLMKAGRKYREAEKGSSK